MGFSQCESNHLFPTDLCPLFLPCQQTSALSSLALHEAFSSSPFLPTASFKAFSLAYPYGPPPCAWLVSRQKAAGTEASSKQKLKLNDRHMQATICFDLSRLVSLPSLNELPLILSNEVE